MHSPCGADGFVGQGEACDSAPPRPPFYILRMDPSLKEDSIKYFGAPFPCFVEDAILYFPPVEDPAARRKRSYSFDPEVWARILSLWNRLSPAFTSLARRRMQLDVLDLSVCLLCTRALKKLVKKGICRPPRPGWAAAANRWEEELECLRKRAKRACCQSLGMDGYRELHVRWQNFEHWLQVHVLPHLSPEPRSDSRSSRRKIISDETMLMIQEECRKRGLPVPESQYGYRKTINDAAVKIAQEELVKAGYTLPAPSVLRKLVLGAIHEIRRRRWAGIPTLLNKPSGRVFLLRFISKRLPAGEAAPTNA